MQKQYVTTSEITEMLKISRVSLYNLIRTKDFPQGFRLGTNRRWDIEEIYSWIRTREGGIR